MEYNTILSMSQQKKDELYGLLQRLSLVILSREEKIKNEIEKIYKKRPDYYDKLAMESTLEFSNEIKLVSQQNLSHFHKLIGIYWDAFKNQNIKEFESLIIKLEPKTVIMVKKNEEMDTALSLKLKEIPLHDEKDIADLDVIKACIIPSIMISLGHSVMKPEVEEEQLLVLDSLNKKLKERAFMPEKKQNMSKEEKTKYGYTDLKKNEVSPNDMLAEVVHTKLKKELVKKFKNKEKERKIDIQYSEYRNVLEKETDIEKITSALRKTFDMAGVYLESFEEKIETKELAELLKMISKETSELYKNEDEIIGLLLGFIYTLAKEKGENRLKTEQKEVQKIEQNKEEEKIKKENEELRKKINELESENRNLKKKNETQKNAAQRAEEQLSKKNKLNLQLSEELKIEKENNELLKKEKEDIIEALLKDEEEKYEKTKLDKKTNEKIRFLREKKLVFVGGYKQWKNKLSEVLPDAKFYDEKKFINGNASFIKNYDYIVVNNLGIKHASSDKVQSHFDSKDKIINIIGVTNWKITIDKIYDSII